MQIGIFDIEVTYDVTRLATEIGHFSDGGIKVSSVNGRIMLSGTARDAVTLDRAMVIARQFAPDPINTVTVSQAQQVMLEVRFVEASRQASRELGVQWNSFGQNTLAKIGSPLPAGSSSDNPVGVAAGLLSGATPYGFLARRAQSRRRLHRRGPQRARAKGPCAQPRGAQPGGAVGRYRELPRRRRVPDPGPGLARHRDDRLQALRRRALLHADRAEGRLDQPEDHAPGERARFQPSHTDHRHLGAATDRARAPAPRSSCATARAS